jgi:Gpi18-like mannosyltransferase
MNQNLKRLEKYSVWVALAVFVGAILLFYTKLFSPFVVSNLNTEYHWSVDLVKGVNIYPIEPHFVEGGSCAYMPLYFIVTAGFMKIFGTSAIVGKLVSTFASLGVGMLLYSLSVKLTGRKFLSIIPGLLFILYPVVVDFSATQVKIDILGLFFTMLSVYLLLNKHILWSVLPAVLAFFTKQYFIALPISVSTFLLWKDRTTLVKYVVLGLVLAAGGFGLGQVLTYGTFFRHVVLFMFDPQFGSETVSRTIAGTLVCLGYLAPALILAGYGIWKTKYFGVLTIYLIVSLVLMVFMIGKVGSGTNYSFESMLAACCLSILVLGRKNAEQRSSS